MQENKDKSIEDLVDDAKGFLEAKVEYTRLYIVEKASKIFADLVTSTAVIVCFILAFLFGSVTLALYLSDLLGSYAGGFGCVSFFYILLAIIVYLTKDKYIEKAIINVAIRKYFDKLADKEEDEKL
ncbi:phage holin family protein [Pedobacter alluvionis]|uniref:Phage holin family protein n=1 Tax=Pedobacter alluvionis TaxID=475253 RepID=A0A497XVI2_9SPHI|nr:phage holin family protein [Pedobacter alluvionis]RLJ73755.1 putative superfamily III holin-X [Pedobacter alluvionis]TFB32629.1 phage holin family protein [Pedobacter alluvionis]